MAFPCLNLHSILNFDPFSIHPRNSLIACIFWTKSCNFNVDSGCRSFEEESEKQRDAEGKREGENRRWNPEPLVSSDCLLTNLEMTPNHLKTNMIYTKASGETMKQLVSQITFSFWYWIWGALYVELRVPNSNRGEIEKGRHLNSRWSKDNVWLSVIEIENCGRCWENILWDITRKRIFASKNWWGIWILWK